MKKRVLTIDLIFILVSAGIMLASVSHVAWAVEYFSDGFESGDFSAWSSTVASGATLAVVGVSPPNAFNGTYFASASGLDISGDDASARHLMTPVSRLYIQVHVRFQDLFTNTSGHVIVGPRFRHSALGAIAVSFLSFNGTHRQWGVGHFVGGGWTSYLESSASTVAPDQWYCVEMELVISSTAGHMHLLVDGVEKVSQSGLDTDDHGNIDTASFGVYVNFNEPSVRTVCFDDFVAGVFEREFLPTDVNKDGRVDIRDIAKVAKAFGSVFNSSDGMYWHNSACSTCPHEACCDVNSDRAVNIVDVSRIAKDFGKDT